MSGLELSIIVPVLNERDCVLHLLEMLSQQTGVGFELILVDGGSTDGTCAVIYERKKTVDFPVILLESAPGRSCQFNLGAERAAAEFLLFLHADSRFPDPTALQQALRSYRSALAEAPGALIGGHFRLQFLRTTASYGFGYYYWEWKAQLDRPECTHGDQGLMLTRRHFTRIGPFDPTALIAPETLLAEKLRCSGSWILFPCLLQTSARRFETEGLVPRQTLNALLMNFASIGWDKFFLRAVDVYRNQSNTDRLALKPYLELIDEMLAEMSPSGRRRIWLATGRYVRTHAWEIPFALDARRAYRSKVPVGSGSAGFLAFHDRWFNRLTNNCFGDTAAAVLTWCWFRWLKRRSPGNGP